MSESDDMNAIAERIQITEAALRSAEQERDALASRVAELEHHLRNNAENAECREMDLATEVERLRTALQAIVEPSGLSAIQAYKHKTAIARAALAAPTGKPALQVEPAPEPARVRDESVPDGWSVEHWADDDCWVASRDASAVCRSFDTREAAVSFARRCADAWQNAQPTERPEPPLPDGLAELAAKWERSAAEESDSRYVIGSNDARRRCALDLCALLARSKQPTRAEPPKCTSTSAMGSRCVLADGHDDAHADGRDVLALRWGAATDAYVAELAAEGPTEQPAPERPEPPLPEGWAWDGDCISGSTFALWLHDSEHMDISWDNGDSRIPVAVLRALLALSEQPDRAEPPAYRQEFDPNTGQEFAHPSTYTLVPFDKPAAEGPTEQPAPDCPHLHHNDHGECESCGEVHTGLDTRSAEPPQPTASIGDVARALLARIVKYAREDRATTPGFTRLARALAEAERHLQSTPACPLPPGWTAESHDDGYDTYVTYTRADSSPERSHTITVWSHPGNAVSVRGNVPAEQLHAVLANHLARQGAK